MEVIHISKFLKKKPLKNLDFNIGEVNSLKKCLFGVPDMEDIDVMLEEQKKADWQRFEDRFGFKIEDIENMENIQLHSNTPSKKSKTSDHHPQRSTSGRRRRLFKPYHNENKITDFYQVRKNLVQIIDKKEV